MFGVVGEVFWSEQIGFPILTFLTFIPLFGALIIWIINSKELTLIRRVALTTTLLNFILSIFLFTHFINGTSDMQFTERIDWISSLGISYHLGIDGISILLVVLTAFLSFLIMVFSWDYIKSQVKEYMICLLALETTIVGVFSSLDLVLFFIFWEVMLIPMYFLIKIWGGKNRDYAAFKFILYTLAGSVLMLVGIIIVYLNYHDHALINHIDPVYSFDLIRLFTVPITPEKQTIIFLLFFFGFAFKVPMFPFHTWLPDAHVEAPTAGSVILAGVLLKMGTYGFIRFSIPLLPDAAQRFVPFMAILALIGIIYGAYLALAQEDIKKLIAYSSISHLGFVMLGLFALNYQGIQGGILQMVNHGISTAGLFFIVGFLYERRHTRLIADFGGLARQIPLFAVFYMIITLSSIGLPGTNGFVGEFLILLGTFKRNWIYAAFGVTGIILGASYMLWLYQRVMFGRLENPENMKLKDLNMKEIIVVVSLVIVVFWIGIYPSSFLGMMDGSVTRIVEQINLNSNRPAVLNEGARSKRVVDHPKILEDKIEKNEVVHR